MIFAFRNLHHSTSSPQNARCISNTRIHRRINGKPMPFSKATTIASVFLPPKLTKSRWICDWLENNIAGCEISNHHCMPATPASPNDNGFISLPKIRLQ